MTVSIEIDADDLARGLTELDSELAVEMTNAIVIASAIVEREASSLAPRRTGALEESIRADEPEGDWRGGTLEGGVSASAPYAEPVHDGSRPHVIEARRGILRFVSGGQVIFARRVNHPGTQPNPFLELALEIRAPEVEAAFASGFDLAMERAGFGR